ncbi:hypothetical protein L7F22_055075 [Adiantum nelumboides]|nr:hypothetical protein [Adiantum nelumboides]
MDSPSSPLQQQSNLPSPDGVHQPNSASHTRLPVPPSRTTGMFAHTSSLGARLKARRSSPSSSSSSPSSSSSSESLSPPTFDFKRSRRHQQRPRVPSLLLLPRAPHSLGEEVDDARCFATQISSPPPKTLKIYPDQVCSLSGSTDPPLPITSQEGNPFILAQPRDTGGTQCADVGRHCDFDKDNRKLLMWRAACAMAHAYVHQHDSHHHELHHQGLRELQQLDNGGIDKEGLSLHEDSCNRRSATSTESAPPLPPRAKISIRDKMYPLPMCPSDDVVCIDEVVNPTQAAEWFGTLFLSTSALVS